MYLASNINNEYFNIFEYYFAKFDALYVEPIIFYEFTIIMLIVYLIRLIMFITIEKAKNHPADKLKSINLYIFRHVTIECLMGYIIAYCLVKMTNANPESYIINMIISPSIGFVGSIFLDIKCIMPLERSNMSVGMPDMGFIAKKDDKPAAAPQGTNITVNVNTNKNDDDCGCAAKAALENKDSNNVSNNNSIRSSVHLNYEDIENEEFNKMIVDSINALAAEQAKRCADMTGIVTKLQEQIDSIGKYEEVIDKIRTAEILDKRAVLKREIYDCLNKGFATPEENDRITADFHLYTSLGGNHEVASLYTDHYLKLDVHEERRKNDIPVNNDRRSNEKKYEYGCLDNVISYKEENNNESI